MKMIPIAIAVLVALTCLPLPALQCAWCKQHMLDGDNYCQNCGREKASASSFEQPKPTPQPTYRPDASLPSSSESQWRRHNSNYHYQSCSGLSDGVGGRFLGMGRGIVTTVLSPLNIIRGALTGASWACESAGSALQRRPDGTYQAAPGHENDVSAALTVQVVAYATIPAGTAIGAVTTCADAVNGAVDLITLGYYGDWLYDSKDIEGNPTPWIWRRSWRSPEIPWINK